jgi:hypothetical protein
VVVVGVSNEREGAPVPGFNAITVAMFQKRIQGSLYGMGSPRVAMPNLLNLYAAGRLKLDELITRRYALDDVNQAYADMRSGVNIRGVVDFIPAGFAPRGCGGAAFSVLGFGRGGRTHAVLRRRVRVLRRRRSGRRGVVR